MPYVKRMPIRGKEGLQQSIEYVKDSKHDGAKLKPRNYQKEGLKDERLDGLERALRYAQRESTVTYSDKERENVLASSINCSLKYATLDMIKNSQRHGHIEDTIQGYHTIQSFSWDEELTPEEVHAIGLELAKKVYPNFQSIVLTHCDKGHLHNHIITSAVDLQGKKLRDDFYDSPTSLTNIRKASDEIAISRGLNIIKDAPLVGIGTNGSKPIAAYIQGLETQQSTALRKSIQKYKETAFTFEGLLSMLASEGYQIKNGKHISVKPPKGKKYLRLDSLGPEFTQKTLKQYFENSGPYEIDELEVLQHVYQTSKTNPLESWMVQGISKQKEELITTRTLFAVEIRYRKYTSQRKKALRRIVELEKALSVLNKYDIHSFEELNAAIRKNESIQSIEKQKIQTLESSIANLQKEFIEYKTYLKYYNIAYSDMELQRLDANAELSEETKLWMDIDAKLGHPGLDAVRQKKHEIDLLRNQLRDLEAKHSYTVYERNHLEQLRYRALSKNEMLLSSFQISQRMIVPEKTNDTISFVRIPYTEYYITIPSSQLVNRSNERKQVFLLADHDIELKDKNGHVIRTVPSNQVAEVAARAKDEWTYLYKLNKEKKSNIVLHKEASYSKETNFVATVNFKLIQSNVKEEEPIAIRLPYSDRIIEVPYENFIWIKENETAQIVFPKQGSVYDRTTQEMVRNEDITGFFEQKKIEFIDPNYGYRQSNKNHVGLAG